MAKNSKKENAEFGIDSRYQSKKQRQIDGKMLMESRLERMKNANPDQIIRARLLQLKFRIEEFLLNPIDQDRNYFTEFLIQYIDTLYDRRNKFARDINISPVKLSQVLNNHRPPQEEFILRLMIHSELIYADVCKFNKELWFQVYYHEKINDTMSSQSEWRPKVEKHVKPGILFQYGSAD